MDFAPNGVFEAKQVTGVIKVYFRQTPVATLTKMWGFLRHNC